MNNLSNQFVQYKKYSLDYPKELSHFKYIYHSLILDSSCFSSPVYALNTLHIQIASFSLSTEIELWPPTYPQNSLPFSAEIELTLSYTCNNYTHTLESCSHTFHLLDTFPLLETSIPRLHLYVEDVFAHALDSFHIYVHITFLAMH